MPISCSAQPPSAARAAPRRRRRGATSSNSASGDRRDAVGLLGVDLEAALQLAHRGFADVALAGRRAPLDVAAARRDRRSRPGAARRAPAAARRCRSASPACRGATGRRRSRRGGRPSARAARAGRRWPASRQRSISQRRPSGVIRPSPTGRWRRAAARPRRPCPTSRAPRCQWRGANGSSASSSSAPAATCASRKARSLKRPSAK